ncbi:MAG: ABC transporter permease, partial [Chloroflexota bacterium]
MTKHKRKRGHASRTVQIPLLIMLAMAFLFVMLVLAVIGGWIAPYDYQETNVVNSLAPPAYSPDGNLNHLLGTDSLGRDVLSRLLLSIRTTVLIAFTGATISAMIGTLLGMIAGQVGGFTSNAIMMAVDVQASLPFLVFALTALAILGNSFLVLLFVIGISGWESYARLARGMVLSVMERDFVLAARSLGITPVALYRRYLLPNILSALIVQFSISLAGTILLESALSFLGLGIQLPQTSLGQMLGEGRDFLLF